MEYLTLDKDLVSKLDNFKQNSKNYLKANSVQAPKLSIPEGKRIPFTWKSTVIASAGDGSATIMKWQGDVSQLLSQNRFEDQLSKRVSFRVTVALDVREEKLVEVTLAQSGRLLGTFDIKYAHAIQPFEIMLSREEAAALLQEGAALKMTKGELPLWIFFNEDTERVHNYEFQPHILLEPKENSLVEFYKRILSYSSIQQFSWMEGCILDGIMDLKGIVSEEKTLQAVERHLNSFFDEEGTLIYENPRSEVTDGKIYGIECTLPFAHLALTVPEHQSLDTAIDFWNTLINEDGSVKETEFTAEGSYTVAYPLAVLSKVRKDCKLREMAVKHFLIRKERLIEDTDLYLRAHPEGHKTFRNWARAYSWYMLGLIRSFMVLEDNEDLTELKEEFRRISNIAMSYQGADGLWKCYIKDDDTFTDTSGSAGIAAALALGYKHGLLGEKAHESAEKALNAMLGYLTPDGFLTGVAQSNKGGEALQRSNYRVISQMAMGLLAQLIGALAYSNNINQL